MVGKGVSEETGVRLACMHLFKIASTNEWVFLDLFRASAMASGQLSKDNESVSFISTVCASKIDGSIDTKYEYICRCHRRALH